jgi:hypothetical protein
LLKLNNLATWFGLRMIGERRNMGLRPVRPAELNSADQETAGFKPAGLTGKIRMSPQVRPPTAFGRGLRSEIGS